MRKTAHPDKITAKRVFFDIKHLKLAGFSVRFTQKGQSEYSDWPF
ncbi:hypothetical protein PRUB_a2731 [Pseudoalteromonas rubra]|uniref:Uncharacterized protein n=1 Tax=Pseudoalteromonas rubra TaxID=43658 RepID=A0A8T0CDK7_9GAMM|nr:hypothetical protein PRUB_a2731 [Pseudoalteromonas rubra]